MADLFISLYLLTFREKNRSSELTGSRITLTDRLRLMESILSDDVINLYRDSQASMTRAQLDSRNSSERQPTFYEAAANKFNNEEYIPFSSSYRSLHPDFYESIELKKSDFVMSADKVKDHLDKAKPLLLKMITNYEKSGMGCMSRNNHAAAWGKFDISLCDGDDDRSNYLENPNSSYLLYMWQRWDEVDLLSFSCAHIAIENTANSSYSPDIASGSPKSNVKSSLYTKMQREMTTNVAMVGDGLPMMASVEMQRQITEIEESKFKLELKKLEYEELGNINGITLIEKRIHSMDSDIVVLKRRKFEYDEK